MPDVMRGAAVAAALASELLLSTIGRSLDQPHASDRGTYPVSPPWRRRSLLDPATPWIAVHTAPIDNPYTHRVAVRPVTTKRPHI